MMKIVRYLFTAILLLIFTGLLFGQAFSANNGYVEFVSIASLLEFKGRSYNLTGLVDLDKNLVDFYVDLTTMDTGINLRNKHMRDSYLETDKYPFAEFTGKIISDFLELPDESKKVTVAGTFTIHGLEQEMEIEGTLTPEGNNLKLGASWIVLLQDHNIDQPRVVFYELADEQTINISINLEPHQKLN